MIIYDGPSQLDGKPIVAIVTDNSDNGKTGAMRQLWILRSDIAPHHAVKTGDDSSVCGNCSHRHFNKGKCYVLPFQAPLSIFTAYMNHSYDDYAPGDLEGEQIRFGAYGDPAAIPFDAIQPILEECDLDHSTGYTHQIDHPKFDPRHAMYCQISADTPKQAIAAHAKGFYTFRVAGDASKRLPNEIECLADSHKLSCQECTLCDGATQNIVITAHGSRANSSKSHDVIEAIQL